MARYSARATPTCVHNFPRCGPDARVLKRWSDDAICGSQAALARSSARSLDLDSQVLGQQALADGGVASRHARACVCPGNRSSGLLRDL